MARTQHTWGKVISIEDAGNNVHIVCDGKPQDYIILPKANRNGEPIAAEIAEGDSIFAKWQKRFYLDDNGEPQVASTVVLETGFVMPE